MSTPIFRRALLPRATTLNFALSSISTSTHPSSSPQTPTSTVSTVVSILTHHRSKSRWSTLLSLFPHGFTPPQISQITLQIRNNPHLAHHFFTFATQNSPTSLHSYATIIHILARAHLKSRAISLIKSAIKEFESITTITTQYDPTEKGMMYAVLPLSGKRCELFKALVETYRVCNSAPFVFDLLIKSYLEMNKLDPCFYIVKLLKSRGIYLHVSTYNALISTSMRLKGCFFGYDLYKDVFSSNDRVKQGKLVPNVHTFNELMASFRQNRVLDMVEEIWIEMMRSKCEPDVCSYSILMAAYCDEGDVEKAEKVWQELRVKGLKPDRVCYNTLIGGYCKIGEVEKGEVLYREMELRGFEGDCGTYEHLIHGYCLDGNVDDAMLVFNVMCSKGFKADRLIVDSLVRVLCCKRSILEGLKFFRSAMETADFAARESTYQLLIKGLCTEGMMEEALKLQAQMAGKGFRPNSDVYDAFINGYIKLGNLDLAENLRKEMMEAKD